MCIIAHLLTVFKKMIYNSSSTNPFFVNFLKDLKPALFALSITSSKPKKIFFALCASLEKVTEPPISLMRLRKY